ncbi:hypothetical protein VTK73DRAFT_6790 [Phialemonium thermophilum]|uniref:Uncharacterized protein n=1 Tax=Phialemonium thermophilum TaxID=223376 RepID=A0ABR3Y748_9PEZI
MDHFPRLRRHKKDGAIAVRPTSKGDVSGKTTPPPGDLEPHAPTRPTQKLSPFRAFHLRSSHKRSRESPPSPLPHSEAAAAAVSDHAVSSAQSSTERAAKNREVGGGEGTTDSKPPKMPSFLQLSEAEITRRFQELVWLERERMLLSVQNPSPNFRWARVTGPHLKHLDRYMNIQPWHNNRIRLQVPEGHLDYINASPIVLPRSVSRSSSAQDTDEQPDRYIAMQGPKQASVPHVWRMVVEQLDSPGVIVMLTETHEANVEKCYPYFPQSKEDPPLEVTAPDEFGDGFLASVRCEDIEETPAGDAIELRKLVIRVLSRGHAEGRETSADGSNGKANLSPSEETRLDTSLRSPTADIREGVAKLGTDNQILSTGEDGSSSARNGVEGEERIVWHFLFKKWPDFGVPSLEDLDSFFTLMRLSREKNSSPGNPRIVHCSAGVGRSGTFIALEHLIRELNDGAFESYDERTAPRRPPQEPDAQSDEDMDRVEEGEDPIFDTVNQLREQRRTMVQAEAQYLFLYQVLRKLWQEKYGSSEENDADEPAAKRLEVDPFVESPPR